MPQVMIVNDDATLTMHLEECLPSIGYEVKGVACEGLEAITMAKEIKPELILMGIKMPGKLNGIQAAAIIKSELGIASLFVTGFSDEDFIDTTELFEPADFLHKPFSEEQLAAALKKSCTQISDGDSGGSKC